jgi:hypothetical protein
MNIPIEVPVFGTMLLFAYMFAYMSLSSKTMFDKVFGIIMLVIWCYVSGFITYANLLSKVAH